jgi:hypothetical protein
MPGVDARLGGRRRADQRQEHAVAQIRNAENIATASKNLFIYFFALSCGLALGLFFRFGLGFGLDLGFA